MLASGIRRFEGVVFLAGVLALASASCRPPLLIDSFTADPSPAEIGGTVTLSWKTTGADSASIDHGIGDVPLDGQVSVTVQEETIFLLTATHGSNVDQRPVIVHMKYGPMAGRVVDGANRAVAGAYVTAGGASTQSDADGGFAFAYIRSPHDVLITGVGFWGPLATLYRGVRTTDATFLVEGVQSQSRPYASVRGTLQAIPETAQPGHFIVTSVYLVTATRVQQVAQQLVQYTPEFFGNSIELDAPTSADFIAVESEWAGCPIRYIGAVRLAALPLSPGGTLDLGVVQVAPISQGAVTANVSSGSDAGSLSLEAFLHLDDGPPVPLCAGAGIDGGLVDVPVPLLSGATFSLRASRSPGVASVWASPVGAGAPTVALSLPAPLVLASPAEGAACDGPDGLRFTPPLPNAICRTSISWDNGLSDVDEARIISTEAGLPAATLTDWSLNLQSGTKRVRVSCVAGPDDYDQVLTRGDRNALYGLRPPSAQVASTWRTCTYSR